MSAFAKRKARHSSSTANPFADGTSQQNVALNPRDQHKGQSFNDDPPQKRQKTAAKLQTTEDILFPHSVAIVKLPPSHSVAPSNPRRIVTVRLPPKPHGVIVDSPFPSVESTSKSLSPRDAGSEELQPIGEVGAPSNEPDDRSDSDFSFDREGFEPRVLPRSAFRVKQLSTFVPSRSNVVFDSATEWDITLEENELLTMVGQYDIWVRRGTVSVLGAVLRRSSRLYRVYAPSTHSLPTIRPIKDPYGPPQQATEITVIVCGSGIRSLKQNSILFRRIWNHKHVPEKGVVSTVDLTKRSFAYLRSSADDVHRRPLRPVESYHDRQILIDKLLAEKRPFPPRVIICGPKNSGKSTFGRLLVNAMVSRSGSGLPFNSSAQTDGVAFLDLDPGQPEYSPPGEISLVHLRAPNLGSPFTHPVVLSDSGDRLIRAHHLGSPSPHNISEHYLKCVQDLLDRYQELLVPFPTCPLVINCAGWILGAGLDILQSLIEMVQSGDIVYTSTRGPHDVVDTLSDSAQRARNSLHLVASQDFAIATRTSAGLRTMQTLSYFHLDKPEAGNLRWDAAPLSERQPLVVHWAGDKQALFAVMVLDGSLDPETMTAILSGNTVGVVAIEDTSSFLYPTKAEENDKPEDRQLLITENGTENGNHDAQDLKASSRSSQAASVNESETEQENSLVAGMAMVRANQHSSIDSISTDGGQDTTNFDHSFIARNSADIPYVSKQNRFTGPLDPTKSFSLGQALVSGIDLKEKCFRLITPIPSSTFAALHQQGKTIILVRGNLDTPTWVAREDWEKGATLRRKLRKEDPEAADRFDAQDAVEWAAGRPHISALEDRVKSVSAKVWRVRRDQKPTRGPGDYSD